MGTIRYDFGGERYAVTGASSGIGRQIAVDLAKCGAEVLAIARNTERLESLRSECPERIFTASLDVCDSNSLEAAIFGFVESHGKLDGGVHSAGIDFLTPLRNSTRDGGGA